MMGCIAEKLLLLTENRPKFQAISDNLHAISIKMAEPLMFDGEVLQHPTTPVMNETNIKKKAVIKSAIIARPMSEKQQNYRLSQKTFHSHIRSTLYILCKKIALCERHCKIVGQDNSDVFNGLKSKMKCSCQKNRMKFTQKCKF